MVTKSVGTKNGYLGNFEGSVRLLAVFGGRGAGVLRQRVGRVLGT